MKKLTLTAAGMMLSLCWVLQAETNEGQSALPQESKLVSVNGHDVHIHAKGEAKDKPLIVLLSGPTDNWHSDSAWWTLAQNYLAENYETVVIDRAGHAWSEAVKEPSYRQFAEDLAVLLSQNQLVSADREIIIVAFASSNISTNLLLKNPEIMAAVKGVVMIDPDVLMEHSINHYSSETERYKAGWDELQTYILSGQYDDRIEQKIESEREHLKAIISKRLSSFMDWEYYQAVENIRSRRDYQVYKFLEASVYLEDLQAAKAAGLSEKVPLVILDTDFESAYLDAIKDDKVKESVRKWRDEGTEWYFNIAKDSQCGAYWPVDSQEHLLMMTQPDLVEQAIKKILTCS